VGSASKLTFPEKCDLKLTLGQPNLEFHLVSRSASTGTSPMPISHWLQRLRKDDLAPKALPHRGQRKTISWLLMNIMATNHTSIGIATMADKPGRWLSGASRNIAATPPKPTFQLQARSDRR